MSDSLKLPQGVSIQPGRGGLPVVQVRTAIAEGDVYLHGATVTHFQPAGQKPVLFVSPISHFDSAKPIRGGIPICWPWFGPHPTDPTKPQHGTARTAEWTLQSADVTRDGVVLLHNLHTPDAYLRYAVTVGSSLTTELLTINRSNGPLTITEALHSYLVVGDVRQVSVQGLAGCKYADRVSKVDGVQGDSPIQFGGEFDRTYLRTTADITVLDPAMKRKLIVKKAGSSSTVVWNPAAAKAATFADLGSDAWPGFVCVETANAASDAVTIAPGDQALMRAKVSVLPM